MTQNSIMKKILLALSFAPFLGFGQQEMFDVCPLKIGQKIPENTKLIAMDGKSTTLKEAIGSKPTILVFFRGGWCPYCVQHLSALQEAKSEIEAAGFQIMAITPDTFDQLIKSDTASKADFSLYSDAGAVNIKAFGLGWKVSDELYNKYKGQYGLDLETWSGSKEHILPVPAVFVLKDGIIQFEYVNPNYSVRLTAETLIAVLKSMKI